MEAAPNFRTHTSTGGPGLGSLTEPARPAASFRRVDESEPLEAMEATSLFARVFHQGPRWLLLLTLISAPWAYGSTREWTIRLLAWQLGIVLAGWGASCLVRREWPRIHPVLLAAAGLLLFQGWWMTLNAKFVFDAALQPTAIESLAAWAPGSVNQVVSWPDVINLSLMLGIACFACDLARRHEWRKRIWLAMAFSGVSLIGFGLAQKLAHAPGIFWQDEKFGQTFFATYRYHANAGSFMNFVWPLVAAWLMLALRKRRSLAEKIL